MTLNLNQCVFKLINSIQVVRCKNTKFRGLGKKLFNALHRLETRKTILFLYRYQYDDALQQKIHQEKKKTTLIVLGFSK